LDSQLFSLRLCAFAGNILGKVDLPQRRKGAKKDQSFCHCVTTKHDVSFVWSLLIHGSSFISSGANNFCSWEECGISIAASSSPVERESEHADDY